MKAVSVSKFLLILIVPLLIFLVVLKTVGFNEIFYKEKFLEYGIRQDIPAADSLHQKVINFIKGASNDLPDEFSQREKQHLWDVRRLANILKIALYMLIALFALLLIGSALVLKASSRILNFVGGALAFGGILSFALAAFLLLLTSFSFSSAFESFHRLFFQDGTYTFDPAMEMLVRLYPEQFFMELGMTASKWVIISSVLVALFGAFLILKSKNKKKI